MSLAEPWYETLNIQSAIFLIMAQPKTNCVFRTFRVKESFWTKKQSCITLKVGIKKWRLFFVFVCYSGCHFTWDGFTKKDNVQKIFFKYLHVCLTCLHIISKIWKYIMLLSFLSQNSQCEVRNILGNQKWKLTRVHLLY